MKINVILLSSLLGGCASVVTGTNQPISIDTEPEKLASCELSNDKGTWFVPSTPGSVVVRRSYSDLTIVCRKEGRSGSAHVKSSAKGMTFVNVLAGGVIGAAVDVGTGAGYDYPTAIHVTLAK